MTPAITALLKDLDVGSAASAANLTVIPLLARREAEPSYLTLDEALARGLAVVTEVSESGSVPQLLVKNGGRQPVLILDGEELIGAKQNRIVNLTILVPAQTTIEIPVSCVEAGRWSHRSRTFASSGRAHYASARAMKLGQVSRNLRAEMGYMADQSAIWADISEKSARMGAHSSTSAAGAMYERRRTDLDAFEKQIQASPNQVGAVFFINGTVAGLDLFDCSATWRKQMHKLVQSYGLDALDRADEARSDRGPDARPFLDTLNHTSAQGFPAIGLGTTVRFDGRDISGAALVADEGVVHLVAFPAQH